MDCKHAILLLLIFFQALTLPVHPMYGVLLPPPEQEAPPLPTNGNNPPPMNLAPPPAGEFASRDELLDFLKDWGEHQGFAVVIGRSRPNRLWIKCDRGGEYADKHLHDPENRKRKRKATRLTGCPFNVKATMKKDKIWRCHTENPQHNHPPSEDLSVHPSLRRMTDEQLAKVNEMTESGKTPVETLEELQRMWPGIKVLRRDIYNARKKYKTEKELAEIAQGLHVPQAFEDPNGKMPGPTRTGRWEWLEDGDEVKRKKRKKSIAAAAGASSSGMEGRESGSPQIPHMSQVPPPPLPQVQQSAPRRQTSNLGNIPARPYQSTQSGQPSQLSPQPPAPPPARAPDLPDFGSTIGQPSPSPRQFRPYNAPAPTPPAARSTYRAPSTTPSSESMVQSTLPRSRTGNEVAPMATMMPPMMQSSSTGAGSNSANSANASAAGGPKAPSGQVLMSRIERMEKEQNEQKQILTQILNAVQGVGTMRR